MFGAGRPIGLELAGYFRRRIEVEDAPVGVELQTISARGLVTLDLGNRLEPASAWVLAWVLTSCA